MTVVAALQCSCAMLCQGRFSNLVRPERCLIMLRRGATGGKLRVIVDWTEALKQILASGGER